MKTLTLILMLNISICIIAGIGEGQSPSGVLPVELTYFSVKVSEKNIKLTWQTATEVNNYGFEIERYDNLRGQDTYPDGSNLEGYTDNHSWEIIGFVEGHGNSNSPKEYSFTDYSVKTGKIEYRLKQIDTDGKFQYSNKIEVNFSVPTSFSISQNYPNPFNPTTIIEYSLPAVQKGYILSVQLILYDMLGREIATLVNEQQKPGYYKVNFDASSLSSGIYFYRISAGKFSMSKKMLLLK